MDYYCEHCHMIQYKEDLNKTLDRWDEPGVSVCGYCGSDDIMELDQVAVAARLHSTITYLARTAFPEGKHVAREYEIMSSALTEWLEDMA